MHEWVDTEITAVLFALAVILAVSPGFAHQVAVNNCSKMPFGHG